MEKRWIIQRGPVRHKGKIYLPGDLLPPEFNERDRARNIYTRRIVEVEIGDSSSVVSSEAAQVSKPTTGTPTQPKKAATTTAPSK